MYPDIDFFLHFYINFPFMTRFDSPICYIFVSVLLEKTKKNLACHKNENPVFMIKIQFCKWCDVNCSNWLAGL
jgi:hypothetical protein